MAAICNLPRKFTTILSRHYKFRKKKKTRRDDNTVSNVTVKITSTYQSTRCSYAFEFGFIIITVIIGSPAIRNDIIQYRLP